MATWGNLNKALTAWRNAIELRLGAIRGRASDGALADAAHVAGGVSQHIRDRDGTVDAFDEDVNLLGSSNPTGTIAERRIIEAQKLDFEQDPHRRGKLWIHNREIANRDIDDYRERDYDGKSPHTEHAHWESDEAHEDDGREWPMPNTDRVLRELGVGNPQGEDDMNAAEMTAWAKSDAGREALKQASVAALETKLKWQPGLERIGEHSSTVSLAAAVQYLYEAVNVGSTADLRTVRKMLTDIETKVAELEADESA